MMLSGNAGPYTASFGVVRPPPWAGSGIVPVGKLKPKKVKKRKYESPIKRYGVVRVESLMEAATKEVSPGVWEFQGKKGVWRTINARRYFFPQNGDPIPPLPEGGFGGGWAEKAKKNLLPKVEAMLLKARRAKRGHVTKALSAMQQAIKAGDEGAFRKAEEKLARASKKEKNRTGR